jgi:FADH2 O2-dependent halogenase
MFDLAIVGSGFGGSLTALVANRLGLRTVLLERGSHPRFAIGESSTPMSNILLESIARDFELPRIRPLARYGTWKKAYPSGPAQIADEVLRAAFRPFAAGTDRSTSARGGEPHHDVADTH